VIREVEAKSIIRRHRRIDSWFLGGFGLNLYRGCAHNCAYCDGRSESYQVEGEFGRDIAVKTNALSILERELDPARKRKPLPAGYLLFGGGVCDAYQPAEERYRLARGTLELATRWGYPVHILTKSVLVERDIDLIAEINRKSRAIVSFSFSSADSETSGVFEPGVPPPERRLETIRRMKEAGIPCGMFLMPVIPFITDSPEMIGETLRQGKEAGIDFAIFGSMTLKAGRQREHFLDTLRKRYPGLESRYDEIYSPDSRWGESSLRYARSVNAVFDAAASAAGIPKRIPRRLYGDLIAGNDLVIIILEHLDYLLKLKGRSCPYGYAAWSLSKLARPLSELSREELLGIKGVRPTVADVIEEILRTGTCGEYERLMERPEHRIVEAH